MKKVLITTPKKIGFLVVISGPSGSGKDYIIDEFFKTDTAAKLNIKKVRTNADRPRRIGEPANSYYFISKKELDILQENDELAEEIVFTGFSRKATSKSEIRKLFEGENLLWRIDPSLASKIAKGEYFDSYFPEHATTLKELTLLIHIYAPKHIIDVRRKKRDQHNYSIDEYRQRDKIEEPYLQVLLTSGNVNVIENLDESLNVTLERISKIITEHYEKIKTKII